MALRGIYSVSASSNVDISARLRAYTVSTTANAEEGSVGISQLVVDDPEGGINITGLRGITLTETSESSNQQVIFKGWTADRDVTRGPSMRTAAARLWHVGMVDQNSLITRRIMRGSDANRPAETDVARVQWLMGTTEFGGVVTNSRYVSTLYPVAMDAVDYRDQSNHQILDDVSQASGKNYYIIWDEGLATPAFGLIYDFSGSSVYRSTLRLTNILGYVDNDITYGVSDKDTKLNRDPSRVYSGVVLPYIGGEVYVQSSSVASAFVSRDTLSPSANVKTSAKATARANRYIADAATESDVIETSFLVPLSRVNHLKEGMAVQCWFAHFPGYDTGWNWMRVLRRTVTATSEEFYTVTLSLSAAVGGLLAGGGLTSDGAPYPAPPIVEPAALQSCVGLNKLTYSYTAFGTRSPLGMPDSPISGSVSTTFIKYWRAGQGPSGYPEAGFISGWTSSGPNPWDGCNYSAGGIDYIAGGVDVLVRFTTIGPGRLTINTDHHGTRDPSCIDTLWVYATASAEGGPLVDSDQQAPGTPLVIDIPDDGYCAHYTDVHGDGPGTWGFISASWS